MNVKQKGEYQRLYAAYLPGLYRAAVYLLGNRASAETVTMQAWLQAWEKAPDETVLKLLSARILVRCCGAACLLSPYLAQEVSSAGEQDPFVRVLKGMEFEERCAVVLCGVNGLSPHEAGRVLRQPAWRIAQQIERAKRAYFLEDRVIAC